MRRGHQCCRTLAGILPSCDPKSQRKRVCFGWHFGTPWLSSPRAVLIHLSRSVVIMSSLQKALHGLTAVLILAAAGCEELGLQNKPDTPAPTVGEAPVAPAASNEPSVELTALPDMSTGGAVGGSAQSPDQFVATFTTKDSRLITDADLTQLAGMSPQNEQVTELSLRGAAITKDGLAQLAKLPALRAVDLSGCTLFGPDWAALSAATQLEVLIVENAALDDNSISAIGALVNLKQLNLSRTNVTDAGFRHLVTLSKLESINCIGMPINGGGFLAFSNKNAKSPLKEIYVTNTAFGTYGLEHINGIDSLEVFVAGAAGIPEAGLKALRNSKHMRILHLSKNPISDQAVTPILTGMDELEELDLSDVNLVSDFTLSKLKNHKALKKVVVNSTACTTAGVQELKQSLPQCSIVINGMEF